MLFNGAGHANMPHAVFLPPNRGGTQAHAACTVVMGAPLLHEHRLRATPPLGRQHAKTVTDGRACALPYPCAPAHQAARAHRGLVCKPQANSTTKVLGRPTPTSHMTGCVPVLVPQPPPFSLADRTARLRTPPATTTKSIRSQQTHFTWS